MRSKSTKQVLAARLRKCGVNITKHWLQAASLAAEARGYYTRTEIAGYLGVCPRAVSNMYEVTAYVSEAGVSKADALKAGSTRLILLAQYSDPSEWSKLRGRALSISCTALEEYVRSDKALGRKGVLFKLTAIERRALNTALLAFGSRTHTNGG